MNKIKMKARAGVTLVELLVVILIVTILSVSLLPLLKPYIEKAKYAAEPIPVLANLQTKIELYQYEKNILPPTAFADNVAGVYYSTWTTNSDGRAVIPVNCKAGKLDTTAQIGHLQDLTDTDWQDLSGKNMRPYDFQYVAPKNVKNGSYVYAVGVFGGRGNSGLAGGTGYAVCKIVDIGSSNKVVGVWERYKSKNEEGTPLSFYVSNQEVASGADNTVHVPVIAGLDGSWDAFQNVVSNMTAYGWSFSN